ncbi:MAG: hypothetical protein RLZZ296_762 [Pseudomonadota bacterium]|jgi:hypothetical protein
MNNTTLMLITLPISLLLVMGAAWWVVRRS